MTTNTSSVDKTDETGNTAADDVHENTVDDAVDKAVEEGKELVEELGNIVAESMMPPGTHIPRSKKKK